MNATQKTSTAAAAAFIAAAGSYIAVCAGHPGWGLVAAIFSIPLGLLGVLMSVSPRVKGGALSIAALIFGAIGLVVSILGITGTILF